MKNSGLQVKKIVLGVIVVAAFVVYSFFARHNSSESSVAASSGSDSGTSSKVSPSSSGSSESSSSPAPTPGDSSSSTGFKDGTYTGSTEDAFYGNVQISAVISGGKLVQVNLLQFPNDNPRTQEVNNQALPVLKQEAIQAQSANVDSVSGATDTSAAFMKSLAAALNQA